MAEVDGRRDYRGGGGYGGGRGSKRKRFREDDDGDRNSYRNQRPRHEAPPGTRLRRGLLEIAEDNLRLPHEVAMSLARLVADNYEDEYVKETFCTVALRLVVEQPLKIPHVAAVVLFAHLDKKEAAQDIVEQAGSQLQEFLNKGQWREFKLMLRFLACVSRLFQEDGVLPILDEIFNRAVDLQTASQDDAVGLELIKIILVTIPYLLAYGTDKSLPQKAVELLERTDVVASAEHPLESLVDPYITTEEGAEKPMAFGSVISLLQRQLQEEANSSWPVKCLPRIFDPALQRGGQNGETNGDSNGDGATSTASKLVFPPIVVPNPANPGPKTLFPELYFSLYADQEVASVPPTSDLASTLIRDCIVDAVNLVDYNRNFMAKMLTIIDQFWADNTFVKAGTAFDKLRDVESGQPTWKTEDVVLDGIFSQIFILPAPELRLVYYHSLITELCKISPGSVAPSLGRGIRFTYRNQDMMDQELVYRYLDWFAHHLSNFDFRWKWVEWLSDFELSDLLPKKAFITAMVEKEMRLSFPRRIRDTLPDVYHSLIPKNPDQPTPTPKFHDESTPFAKEGQKVHDLLKAKAKAEEVQEILDSVTEQAAALGIADPLATSTDVYMTAILAIGSKSQSHVVSIVDRCKQRLLSIGQMSEPAKRQIISSVMDFWHEYPGTAVNIIDKLLNYTIVSPMNVIQWALTDKMDRGRALTMFTMFELVSITMFKVTNRIHQVLNGRNDVNLPFLQRQEIEQALPREVEGMRALFKAIEDTVSAVAAGAQDEMIERYDDNSEEQELLKTWGARWLRVFSRKAAIEEVIVNEAIAKPLEEPPAPPAEVAVAVDVEEDMDQIS